MNENVLVMDIISQMLWIELLLIWNIPLSVINRLLKSSLTLWMTLIFLFCLTLLRLFLSPSPTRSIFLFFPFCVSPLSVFHPIKPLELTANQLWKWPALLKSRLTMLLSDKRFTKPSFPDTYPLGCQGKRPPFRCLRNKTRLTGNDASDITISKPSERMFHGNKST